MIVTFIIDQMRLIIVLQNFGICGVDNVTSIKSKDAMILETVGGCREGRGEFREKILKGRQRDLRPALVKSRLRRDTGRIKFKVIHDFVRRASFAHTDNHTHGIVKGKLTEMLT